MNSITAVNVEVKRLLEQCPVHLEQLNLGLSARIGVITCALLLPLMLLVQPLPQLAVLVGLHAARELGKKVVEARFVQVERRLHKTVVEPLVPVL